jgi:hypothetical protein
MRSSARRRHAMNSFSGRKAAGAGAGWAVACGFILLTQPQSVFAFLASPTITAQASTPALVGGSLTDTAILAGGASPTGTITFELRSGGCGGSAVLFTSIKTVSGNGSYTSGSYGPLADSTEYNWQVIYSGDANNNPVSTLCGGDGAQSVAVPQYCPSHSGPVPTSNCGTRIVTSTSSTTSCTGSSARVTVTTVAVIGPTTAYYGPEKSLSCSVVPGGTDYNTNVETVTVGAGAVEIPTLSALGLLGLAVVLFGVGLWVIMGRD